MQPLFIRPTTLPHPALLAVALLICVLGTYAIAVLGQAALAADRRVRLRWMALAILAGTCAVWADSFIAMLAVVPASRVGVAWPPMLLSFVVGFVLMALAAQITMAGRFRLAPALGGAMAGLAISATHYVGLRALHIVGVIDWDFTGIALSVAFGVLFGLLSAVFWLRSRSSIPVLPIALFAIAICGTHFIAIGAAEFSYDAGVAIPAASIGGDILARIVGLIGLLVVGFMFVAGSMNRKSRRLRAQERQLLQQLADVAVEALVICAGSRIVWVNRSFESLRPGARSTLIGATIESVLVIPRLADLRHDREVDAELRAAEEAIGSPVPVRVITRAITLHDRPHVVVAIRDQRARLEAEAVMQRLAESDALTGLANRGHYNAVLERLFALPRAGTAARAAASGFALLSLDLDRFKSVNDTHGHAAGDAVLIEVAARLKSLVREGDVVARLGGDEFGIIARTGIDPSTIRALADRVIARIAQPFIIDSRVHLIGVSVGVAFAATDGDDPESLTRSADLALYCAKAEGRSMQRTFEPDMRIRMQERHGIEQALVQAVAAGEFRLHYQAQVDARTGIFSGAEALIRWMHPTRGLVPPSEFIAIAEETDLISTIGEWVLRSACKEAATWPDDLVVAVNLSPVQFLDPSLTATVSSALAASGLPGRRLELEVTETVLIDDKDRVKAVLDELKSLGVRLSLDDFGTGYSSLGHLHRFPFDRIKIDRSFIARAPDDAGSIAIIRAVVALGVGLGMRTTAEGVETEAQRRFVTEAGCDQIQGFLFSRPVPPEDLPDAFRHRPSRIDPVRAALAVEA